MDEKITYWASVILGGVALLLLIVNMSLINGNRHMQEEVNQRQTNINSGGTLEQLNKGIVQALADIATKENDSDARSLLAAQGITITPPVKVEDTAGKKKPEKSEE